LGHISGQPVVDVKTNLQRYPVRLFDQSTILLVKASNFVPSSVMNPSPDEFKPVLEQAELKRTEETPQPAKRSLPLPPSEITRKRRKHNKEKEQAHGMAHIPATL
jgi:hypothetical protein